MTKFITLLSLLSFTAQALAATAPQTIPNDSLLMGKTAAGDKTIIFNNGAGAANPKLKWENSTSKLKFSNDGTNFKDIGSGSGGAGVNYLTNGDLEAQLTGWNFYNERQDFATTDVNTSTEVITLTAHGLANGDQVRFISSTTLPGGLSAGTTYYVISATTNTIQVSATLGGSAVDLTSVGSGTHTVIPLQPVDATGSGNGTTFASNWTASTSSPLSGAYSMLYAHGAANEAGTGQSTDFTIDSKDQGRSQTIYFDYTTVSGTYDSSAVVPGLTDLTFWIYDRTNGVRIAPSSYRIENVVAGTKAQVAVTFPTNYNSTLYRLAVHSSTTTATAYSIKFDNFRVGPQSIAQGGIITPTQSCTTSGTWAGGAVYACQISRVGDVAHISVGITFSSAPTGAGQLYVNLPNGLSIDTSKRAAGTSATTNNIFGTGKAFNGSTLVTNLTISYGNAATNVAVSYENTAAGTTTAVTTTTPYTFAAGMTVDFEYSVPIVGWNATGAMTTSETSARPIVFKGSKTQTISTLAAVLFTASKDTVGGYNAITGEWTAPVDGDYDLKATSDIGGTSGNVGRTWVYINGVADLLLMGGIVPAGGNSVILSGAHTVTLKAGDKLTIQHSNSISTSTSVTASLKLSPGNVTLQSMDVPRAKYSITGSLAPTHGSVVVVPFDTKVQDNYGMASGVGTSSFKLTAPMQGTYAVAECSSVPGKNAVTGVGQSYIYKSPSTLIGLGSGMPLVSMASADLFASCGSTTVQLLAGEAIFVKFYSFRSDGTVSNYANDGSTYVSFWRVGDY